MYLGFCTWLSDFSSGTETEDIGKTDVECSLLLDNSGSQGAELDCIAIGKQMKLDKVLD
jgi:hypothetical protein